MAGLDSGAATVDVQGFLDTLRALMDAGDPRVRLVGRHTEAAGIIDRHAARVRRSAWNMQRIMSLAALRAGLETGRRHPAGNADARQLVSPAALRACPLVTSALPDVRVGSVPFAMLATDETHVFLDGPEVWEQGPTIWETTDPALVAEACRVFVHCWDRGRPAAAAGPRPLLPARSVEVAFLLVDGASDREIADALGVGTRTASSEVRRVVDWTGTSNRARAIAVLSGVDQ